MAKKVVRMKAVIKDGKPTGQVRQTNKGREGVLNRLLGKPKK